MRREISNEGPVVYLLFAAILVACASSVAQSADPSAVQTAGQTIVSDKQMRKDAAGFTEFSGRVQSYIQLHNSVEMRLQRVKRADSPENINAHQSELADGIGKARLHAHRGDLFTPGADKAIRNAIRSVFQSGQAIPARATIEHGAPLEERHLKVNQLFPKPVPYSSVPAFLLLKLPPLPNELAYRVVGHDLVLVDVSAGLVVDSLDGVIP